MVSIDECHPLQAASGKQEKSLRLSDSEREALVRDEGRAGQRLLITYVGDVPEGIRSILVSGSKMS
jgi:hypothetical protein